MRKSLLLASLLIASLVHAADVTTIVIRSKAMNKDINCTVIRPAVRDSLPVLYLLHGWSGKYSNWITKVPALQQYADQFHVMIVCPDGEFASWYVDSPVDPSYRYETYISTEVPAYIDAHYATIRSRSGRAISGLSMGGHGALFIAFRHAETFGAAGSMSGALDLRQLKTKYDIFRRLGDTSKYAGNYKEYSVIGAIEHPPADSLALIIDCGTEDGFIGMNGSIHRRLLQLKIAHDYIERPGGHDWNYWGNSVRFQLLFFSNYFVAVSNRRQISVGPVKR